MNTLRKRERSEDEKGGRGVVQGKPNAVREREGKKKGENTFAGSWEMVLKANGKEVEDELLNVLKQGEKK